MATIQDLANSIAKFEGYFVSNSVAARNNNPGNLRYANQTGTVGKDSKGFAIFGTAEEGWTALSHQINLDANRGLTLASFMNKYAPSSENDTNSYLSYVSSQTGVDPSMTLDAGFRRG